MVGKGSMLPVAGLEIASPIHRVAAELGIDPGTAGALVLDHLGIAVRSIAQARTGYELLGLVAGHEERIEHEQVRTLMLHTGTSRLELLEPTAEDSVIGRFLVRRGEGLHHVALRSSGIEALFERLRLQGVRLASGALGTGVGGHRYFFVHPTVTSGVLVEIVGDEEKSREQGVGNRE